MGDWQGYIDTSLIGSGFMHSAAIVGLSDGSYWAYGGQFVPQPEELKHILKALKDPNLARQSGVHIGGEKFIVYRAEPGLLYFKKGAAGGTIATSVQTAVIGVFGDPKVHTAASNDQAKATAQSQYPAVNPPDCNSTVEGIAAYLKQSQY